MKIASKSQASKMYSLYKSGKLSYPDMMKMVHATGDMSKLPEKSKGRPPKNAIDIAI